jgi:hypothetical protein
VTRRRIIALALIWTLPTLVLLNLTWCIYDHYRIRVPDRLGDDARAEVMRVLRASLENGDASSPTHAELRRGLPDEGPVVVTVWWEGRQYARADGYGPTIDEAVFDAATRLPAHPGLRTLDEAKRKEARIKVDLIVGRGPLNQSSDLLQSVSVNPGLEGLGVVIEGNKTVTLMPDRLMLWRLLSKTRPLKFVPEFNVGLDFDQADARLAEMARLEPGAYGSSKREYFRFRTDSFVERPLETRDTGAPLALYRGLPPGPELSAESLREGALMGAKFLVDHLAPNGRYLYERSLTTGQGTDPMQVGGPYSIPRHAGTTYFLAEVYRHTKEDFLKEPIERAFRHLGDLISAGDCRGTLPSGAKFACVIDKGQKKAGLGSTALGVVALAEYQRATGEDTYLEMATEMTEWILYMQRDDGSFRHLYEVAKGERDEHTELLYYSGESALALARMYEVTKDERYRDAAERALDDLVGWYDFFVGGFFYGEEHWTCIASEAIWPAVKKDSYRRFCDGYGKFLRLQQAGPGDFPDQGDLNGAYGVSPFVMPHNTPAGSRSEAMISSYLLGKYHGKPSEAIRGQVLAAMQYVLRQQIRPDNDFQVRKLRERTSIGAIPASPIDRNVRIDYVQHVCSAMIRAIELIETPPR